uniref:Protein farnesyltransferase/geranylgeranyltransferase type-1 subunit alpha n=1 Tax=Meloidogyne javanica TaxID=6303 RepID=A0A915MID4_MELJA
MMTDFPDQQNQMLYSESEEWKDIKPIYNTTDEDCAVKISTNEEFDDAFAYLRAVMNANDLSERVLELTTTCISLNAANYSVWNYRRKVLRVLGLNIEDELKYCETVIGENPKNYQVWYHRRAIVEESGEYRAELEFTASKLEDDSKNYHAWQHRQWVVEYFNLFSPEEMDFADSHLKEDLRNNSAWNYRYFICLNLSDRFQQNQFLQIEIEILINDDLGLQRPEIVNVVQELLSRILSCSSPHLHLFVVNSLIEQIRKCTDNKQKVEYSLTANQHLKILEEIEPTRIKYWHYMKKLIDDLVEIPR